MSSYTHGGSRGSMGDVARQRLEGQKRLHALAVDLPHITSTATIFGPPFIAPVAIALRNRELVVSGLTTGLMGYAVGTYLGLAVAWLLRP